MITIKSYSNYQNINPTIKSYDNYLDNQE